MATAHQIRDLIAQTTTGGVRPRVPREERDEVCRYAARRRKEGAPWTVIARETGLDVRKLQRCHSRARRKMGSARAPVVGSGRLPACTERVLNPSERVAVSLLLLMVCCPAGT